jgi:hypothetical protein
LAAVAVAKLVMLKADGQVGYWKPELDMVSCDFWSSWWAIEKATLNLTYCWQTFPELALPVEQSGFEYKLIGKGALESLSYLLVL